MNRPAFQDARPVPAIPWKTVALLLLAPCFSQAEHLDIQLVATSANGAKQQAFADQSPPVGGLNPRPILKVRLGDKIGFQFILTNVYTHGTFRDAGVRYYIVPEKVAGQKALPALENATVEGSFNFDFKPKARIAARQNVLMSHPGTYLLRVESFGTQRDHEHFAAIDLEVH